MKDPFGSEGFAINFLGVVTNLSYFPPASEYLSQRFPTFNEEYHLWDRRLMIRRPAMTHGFVAPGFEGLCWMWPEEYAVFAKYVDLTQDDYLEIGSMCGVIAMSLAEKYAHRNFVRVDAFSEGLKTIAGEKETLLKNQHRQKFANATLVEGDSREVLAKLDRSFDVVLVDYACEYVLADALNPWRLLCSGGYIAFDDYARVEETTRAVHDFVQRTSARIVEAASSLVVVSKPANAPQFFSARAESGEHTGSGKRVAVRTSSPRVAQPQPPPEFAP